MQASCWQLVEIYPSSGELESNLLPLTINHNEVRFLRQSILSDSRFSIDQDGNWHLRFFVDTEFEQRLFVRFLVADNVEALRKQQAQQRDYNLKFKYLTRLVFSHLPTKEKEIDSQVLQASRILKDTESITEQHLFKTDYYRGYIDGRGEIFLSKYANDANFKRHTILHALAQAYMLAMSQLKHRLRPSLVGQGDIRVLRAVYQDFVRFNANCFYMQPVLYDRPSMCEAWQRIDDAYRVCAENRELFEKIKSVHFLLDLENSEKEAEHREKSNAKMSQLSITIAVVGVIIALSTWLIEYLGY
jgi:hypothetical protein